MPRVFPRCPAVNGPAPVFGHCSGNKKNKGVAAFVCFASLFQKGDF
jgi:hypothetical protein